MSISGLAPRALHKGTSASLIEGGALLISLLTSPSPEFQAMPSLPQAFSTWTTLLYPTCPAHCLQPTPDLYLSFLILPGAFSFTNPSFSSSSFPIPPSTSPEIADILHSGIGLLSPPPFFIHISPLSPRTSLMRVEELLGRPLPVLGVRCLVRHTCVSVIPFPSVAAWKLICTTKSNEGLFIYLSLYLFIYLRQW